MTPRQNLKTFLAEQDNTTPVTCRLSANYRGGDGAAFYRIDGQADGWLVLTVDGREGAYRVPAKLVDAVDAVELDRDVEWQYEKAVWHIAQTFVASLRGASEQAAQAEADRAPPVCGYHEVSSGRGCGERCAACPSNASSRATFGCGYDATQKKMADAYRAQHPIGRPPVPDSQRLTKAFNLRLTAAQDAKMTGLGGAKWLRDQIDKA